MANNNYTEWYGFKRLDFTFEGREAILILPGENANGKWICKTEYFSAFQELEVDLVSEGYHLAYIKNKNRLGTDEDNDKRARFADYLSENYGLEKKFVPIGMSCGGLHAVNFASRYPDYVSMLYLDAPVMNFLSWPMGFGQGKAFNEDFWGWKELVDAYGFTLPELLCYREHGYDRIPVLLNNKIPVALVYGEEDTAVPYKENGAFLEKAYREEGLPFFCVGKPGCGHHPHGLSDRKELIEFIKKYS